MSIPDVVNSFGEALFSTSIIYFNRVYFHLNFGHILWILSLVLPIRLIDNNDILKATPTVILARFLFIHPKVNCILYNYCKLLVNSNQLNIVLSDSVKYKSFIQSMYSISKRGSMSSRFFGLVASLGNVVDLTRFNEKMIVRRNYITYTVL